MSRSLYEIQARLAQLTALDDPATLISLVSELTAHVLDLAQRRDNKADGVQYLAPRECRLYEALMDAVAHSNRAAYNREVPLPIEARLLGTLGEAYARTRRDFGAPGLSEIRVLTPSPPDTPPR